MPNYYCKDGSMGKFRTDEEKISSGFMSGNCIDACIDRFTTLYNKFGDNFDIVMILSIRETATLQRLMNEEQRTKFMSYGKYLIHYMVYNRKTEQYIDTSNGGSMIQSKENEHRHFTAENNKYYAIYHYPIEYFTKYCGGRIGKILSNRLKNQHIGFTKKEEKLMIKKGVSIYKCN